MCAPELQIFYNDHVVSLSWLWWSAGCMRWSFDWKLPSSSNIPATRSSPGLLPPTSSRKSKVSHFVCTLTYVLYATVNEYISYLSASNVYREAFLKNGWHRENFSDFVFCVIAEMRSNGAVPANYLLEGLN